MNLYVIHDKLAEESGPLFEAKNDATASRSFNQLIEQNPGTRVTEFALLRLGSIDHATNAVTLLENPEVVFVPQEV